MSAADSLRLEPYVPRLLVQWLREEPDARWRAVEGTLAFADISGFTALTEKLARKGKVGAEEMSDILNATFAELLDVAYADDAGLVKWGGDAMLLLFEGADHAARATRAALRMRDRLGRVGVIGSGSSRVTLRMSVGVHSGLFHFFLVGDPAVHRELIVTGPGATRTAEMEAAAEAGEVVVSAETAALLAAKTLGEARGDGRLVIEQPAVSSVSFEPRPSSEGLDIASLIPTAIRRHLLGGQGEPEHRRITAAFVKFGETDALLRDQGAQALADALDDLVRSVQAATERTGVTFFETDIDRDGGKIMLTAGAPVSADHDEDRMLRAARQIVEHIGVLPVRVGVNRGPIFAGDFGPPFRRTFSVKGDAVNLAARLLGRAEAGHVVATQSVLDRSSARFDVEPLEPFMVKGKSEPVHAARVGRLAGESDSSDTRTPLVGRDVELAFLTSAWANASAGAGNVVVLAGEPGIGKSRLVAELLNVTQAEHRFTRGDEYETATAYFPLRGLLRDLVGAGVDADDAAVAEHLVQWTESHAPDLRPWLPLVAAVLDVRIENTPEVDALADEFRRERLEDVVCDLLSAALDGPTVIVVDDAHLIDDASTSLLHRIATLTASRPWLLLVTRRDTGTGFEPTVGEELRPAPLGETSARELLVNELADTPLTPSDITSLVARAGGNPLFLRGLVLAAREGATVDELPETVEALITSQIDRLPADERTVLRVASVLGMGFSEEELRHLLHGRELPSGPDSVRRLGYFVRPEGHGRFRFDHQLIRDTAYEGLPYRLRKDLHGQAGDLIESTSTDPDDVAELLSLHFLHAGRPERAWHYARVGGERAVGKFAYAQAEELYSRALTAARGLTGIEPHERAVVQIALGDSRRRIGRSAESLAAFRAARALLADDPVAQAEVLSREADVQRRLGNYAVALRTATRGLRLLEGRDEPRARSERSTFEMISSGIRASQGRYSEALSWARLAEAEAELAGDVEARASASAMIHGALLMLGTPDRSYGEAALHWYEEAGDRLRQSEALNNLALLSWTEGRGTEALEMFRRAHDLAAESGDSFQAAATAANVGDVLVRLGRLDEAEKELRACISVLRALEADTFEAVARRSLGLALAQVGRTDEGERELVRAREQQLRMGERDEVVETDAALAYVALVAGRVSDAAEAAEDAAERARDLEADHVLPFALRVAGAALVDDARIERGRQQLELALAVTEPGHVERGFVLAELARAAAAAGDHDTAVEFASQAKQAWDVLGFVGTPRYPRA